MPDTTLKPEFVSRRSLATLLDCSESTVDELTRRGVIPRPLRLTGGVVRWHWHNVVLALESLRGASNNDREDPAMVGVRNLVAEIAEQKAAKAAKKGGKVD